MRYSIPFSRRAKIVAALILAALVCAVLIVFQTHPRHTEEMPLRIALAQQPSSALAIIALDAGFFRQAGLEVEFHSFPSGKRGLEEGLLAGKTDVATVSDLPAIIRLAEGAPVVIIATIQAVRSVNAIVARPDQDIESIADLKGRRVGVQPLSAVHFFAHQALLAGGVSPDEVQMVFYRIEDLPTALAAGDIDAVSIREPYISMIRQQTDDRAIIMEHPWVYPQFEFLVVQRDFSRTSPKALIRMLQALFMAEKLINEHPEESAAILANALDIPASQGAAIMNNTINRVSLNQSLLTLIKLQLAWLHENGQSIPDASPEILEFFDFSILQQIEPARIDIAGFGYMETE